jgi:hypothetical protein
MGLWSVESILERYGRMVGKRPCTIAGISAILLILLGCGWVFSEKNNEDIEFVWGVTGSELEEELKTKRALHNEDWFSEPNLAMFTSKDQIGDVFTPDHFDEMLDVYAAAFNLSVTTRSGKQYSMYDLCNRGSMPDLAGAPIFPCFHVTPLQCFSEIFETLHPSYQAVDPIANALFGPQVAAIPYSTRPSYRKLGAAGMKAEASKVRDAVGNKGCSWYTGTASLPPAYWGGGMSWNANGTLEKVEGLQIQFFMDAPKRGKFRLNLTRPDLADESEFSEATELFNIKLEELFMDRTKHTRFVDISFLRIDFTKRINDESSEVPVLRMCIACLLLSLFVYGAFANFTRPLRSHTCIGGFSLLCVYLAYVAAGGAIGWIGIKWNPTMIQCLPFLAVGLGVNDMFVLLLGLAERGAAKVAADGPEETLAVILGSAGVGVTLTSICNTLAFLCSSFIPVPGVSDFCIGAALVAVVNYVVVMTLFAACLFFEAKRMELGQIEYSLITCFCHRSKRCIGADEGLDTQGWGSSLRQVLEKRWVPILLNRAISSGIVLLSMGILCVCIWQIKEIEMGVDISDLVKDNSPSSKGLRTAADLFTTSPVELYYHNVDIPNHQHAILNLLTDIFSVEHVIPNTVPPFLAMFYGYVQVAAAAGVPGLPNTTLADLGWKFETSAGSHPIYAPMGVAAPDKFYEMFENFRSFPFDDPARAYMPGGNAFVMADLVGAMEFAYDGNGHIKLGFDRLFSVDCKSTAENVEVIEAVRAKIQASPLKGKVFPSGPQFTYFEIYRELKTIFWKTFFLDLGVIFIVIAFTLRALWPAVASTVACALIVVEIFGVCALYAKFNMVSAAALLMGMGLSVDFVVHVVASFQLSQGSIGERLTRAVCATFPAVLLGGISTFVSLLPMGFSDLPFTRRYFFGLFVTVTGFGLLNGILVLPAMLGLIKFPKHGIVKQVLAFCQPGKDAKDSYPTVLGSNTDQGKPGASC